MVKTQGNWQPYYETYDLPEGWVHISCNHQTCLHSFIFNCSRFLINKQSNIISYESGHFQNISLYNQMPFIQIIEEMALIMIK